MNIKKAGAIIDQINDVVVDWDQYANEADVDSNLRDAIRETLVRLD